MKAHVVNGFIGAHADTRFAMHEHEFALQLRRVDPSAEEYDAILEAAGRWGQKSPCPVDVLTDRLGEGYRTGIDSLTALVALVEEA